MESLTSWLSRAAGWLTGRRRDSVLDEEMEAHRAFVESELQRAGMTRAEAFAESRKRMGNVALAREDSRDVWIVRWADRLRQHLRFGIRGLARNPGFAITAILTLGLGTAATTTVFSVVNAEIWQHLPYPNADRLISIRAVEAGKRRALILSPTELLEWRSAVPAVIAMAGDEGDWSRRAIRMTHTDSIATSNVTANYFTTLERVPILGRVFSATDVAASQSVVLGERAWRRLFDADPATVGRAVMLDDEPRVVIGVVAYDGTMGPDAELFVPVDETSPASTQKPRLDEIFARLAPGATIENARGQLQALLDRRRANGAQQPNRVAVVEDLSLHFTRTDRRAMYVFLGASLLVLILTVSNVAGLMLARAFQRVPEFALRGALGSGVRALSAQLVVEAALVAVPGSAIGLLLAYEATSVLDKIVPSGLLQRGTHVTLDAPVAALSIILAIAATIGVALAPIAIARRTDTATTLGATRRVGGSPAANRARHALLAAQLALTVTLLAGAGIFLESFTALTSQPLGFNPENGWSLNVELRGPRYRSDDQIRLFANGLVERARAIPGIEAASVATSSPLRSGWLITATESGVQEIPGAPTMAVYRAVGDDYFKTIGTPIVRGRGFLASDAVGAADVVIVNEAFVLRRFGRIDPIGKRIDIKSDGAPIRSGSVEIVGVASDVKEVGLHEQSMADLYVPFSQRPSVGVELVVRSSNGSESVAPLLRAASADVDSTVPVISVSALSKRVVTAQATDRFNVMVIASVALVAMMIGGIGIYGAMAYAALSRRREFGVRLALGATSRSLLGGVLWRSVQLGLVGGAMGLVGTVAIGAAIRDVLYSIPGKQNGLLFHVTTHDPMALTGAVVAIIIVAVLAGVLPARRAAKVNPVETLRAE